MIGKLITGTIVLLASFVCGAYIEVEDQAGDWVSLPEPPSRVVSAYGVATYYVYALGEGDRLTGARYAALPGRGGALGALHREMDADFDAKFLHADPTTEEVLAGEAELVLTNPIRNKGMAEVLRDLGVPVAAYVPESLDSVLEAIALTGTLLGGRATTRAEELVTFLEGLLSELDSALMGLAPEQRPSTLLVGLTAQQVASGAMLQHELIVRAGGRSVSEELTGGWRTVSVEQVIRWDPDVIVIAPYGTVQPETLLDDPHWGATTAVRNGRVYKMPRLVAPWDSPVPDAVLGTLWLAQVLHPQKAPADIAEHARDLYETFYGLTLSAELIDSLQIP